MEITFMRLMGVCCFGFGGYILLSLAVPRLRDRKWQSQPASLFLLGTSFCILLGLWAFGIARPYTWIAAVVVWGLAFLVQRPTPCESGVPWGRIMERREAILALVLLAGMIVVMLRVFVR
jgi:hypothetical protein